MKQIVFTVLKVSVSLAVVWYVVAKLGYQQIVDSLAAATVVHVLIAAGLFVVSGILGALQWKMLLATRNVQLPVWPAIKFTFIGMFFNNFFLGMVAGDAVKITVLKSHGYAPSGGISATFLDRFAGLLAMMGFAVAGSFMLLRKGLEQSSDITSAVIALFVAAGVFVGIFLLIVSRRLQRFTERVLATLRLGFAVRILRALSIEFSHRRVLLPVGIISTFIQLLRICVHIFCGISLGIVSAANMQYFFIFVPLLAIIMLAPLPFGIKELGGANLFILAGFSQQAIVMEFLAAFVGIVSSGIGALFFITNRRKLALRNS